MLRTRGQPHAEQWSMEMEYSVRRCFLLVRIRRFAVRLSEHVGRVPDAAHHKALPSKPERTHPRRNHVLCHE